MLTFSACGCGEDLGLGASAPCVDGGGGGGDKDDEEVFIGRKIDFAKNLQCSETQLGAFIHGMELTRCWIVLQHSTQYLC